MKKHLHDVFSPFTSIRLVVVVGSVVLVNILLLQLLAGEAALKLDKRELEVPVLELYTCN